MRKIGLIDVDGHNYPNLPLMKLSAWHKKQGDSVEWYSPLLSPRMDTVYMSKVFSFTQDYQYNINSSEVVKGGTGYAISTIDGVECFDENKDKDLPAEIEHTMPDYSLYGVHDSAYGFLTRGCPRGCKFCHVKNKEGLKSRKVADLDEFWDGQKNIILCDPNILACPECESLLQQLVDSRSKVDFNQGVDIRLMTEKKAELLKNIKTERIHFAWDQYDDKNFIIPKFKLFKEITNLDVRKLSVYVLCGFDTTIEQDLDRIYTLRDLGYSPFVMIYNKYSLPDDSDLIKLQRWVNNKFVFWSCDRFEEYKRS